MASKNRVSKLTGGNKPAEGETRPPKKLGRRSGLPQKRDERSLEKVDDV